MKTKSLLRQALIEADNKNIASQIADKLASKLDPIQLASLSQELFKIKNSSLSEGLSGETINNININNVNKTPKTLKQEITDFLINTGAKIGMISIIVSAVLMFLQSKYGMGHPFTPEELKVMIPSICGALAVTLPNVRD